MEIRDTQWRWSLSPHRRGHRVWPCQRLRGQRLQPPLSRIPPGWGQPLSPLRDRPHQINPKKKPRASQSPPPQADPAAQQRRDISLPLPVHFGLCPRCSSPRWAGGWRSPPSPRQVTAARWQGHGSTGIPPFSPPSPSPPTRSHHRPRPRHLQRAREGGGMATGTAGTPKTPQKSAKKNRKNIKIRPRPATVPRK